MKSVRILHLFNTRVWLCSGDLYMWCIFLCWSKSPPSTQTHASQWCWMESLTQTSCLGWHVMSVIVARMRPLRLSQSCTSTAHIFSLTHLHMEKSRGSDQENLRGQIFGPLEPIHVAEFNQLHTWCQKWRGAVMMKSYALANVKACILQ
jgi:hypothetical protein